MGAPEIRTLNHQQYLHTVELAEVSLLIVELWSKDNGFRVWKIALQLHT